MTEQHSNLRRCTDFEEFSAIVQGYDLDLIKLDQGRFSARAHQIQSGTVLLSHLTATRRLEIRGGSPPDLLTFGIPTARCQPFVWRQQTSDGDTVQVYRHSTELEVFTHRFFEAIDLSVPAARLETLSESLGLPDLDVLIGGAEMLRCRLPEMSALRRALHHVSDTLEDNPSLLNTAVIKSTLEVEIPLLLLNALQSARRPKAQTTYLGRGRCSVARVTEYIRAFSDQRITLEHLCKEAHVSARTLQHQFKAQLGISPKAYLNAQRMNKVYKKLRESDLADTTITVVANRCGFSHLAQFSTDYRRLFGELPSETLRKR